MGDDRRSRRGAIRRGRERPLARGRLDRGGRFGRDRSPPQGDREARPAARRAGHDRDDRPGRARGDRRPRARLAAAGGRHAGRTPWRRGRPPPTSEASRPSAIRTRSGSIRAISRSTSTWSPAAACAGGSRRRSRHLCLVSRRDSRQGSPARASSPPSPARRSPIGAGSAPGSTPASPPMAASSSPGCRPAAGSSISSRTTTCASSRNCRRASSSRSCAPGWRRTDATSPGRRRGTPGCRTRPDSCGAPR